MNNDESAALIAEKLHRSLDLMRAELSMLRSELQHIKEIENARLAALEKNSADYEARLRTLSEAATQFRLLASLATGGGLISLVALIKALIAP